MTFLPASEADMARAGVSVGRREERERIIRILREKAAEYRWLDADYVCGDGVLPVGKMADDLRKIIRAIQRSAPK